MGAVAVAASDPLAGGGEVGATGDDEETFGPRPAGGGAERDRDVFRLDHQAVGVPERVDAGWMGVG